MDNKRACEGDIEAGVRVSIFLFLPALTGTTEKVEYWWNSEI